MGEEPKFVKKQNLTNGFRSSHFDISLVVNEFLQHVDDDGKHMLGMLFISVKHNCEDLQAFIIMLNPVFDFCVERSVLNHIFDSSNF